MSGRTRVYRLDVQRDDQGLSDRERISRIAHRHLEDYTAGYVISLPRETSTDWFTRDFTDKVIHTERALSWDDQIFYDQLTRIELAARDWKNILNWQDQNMTAVPPR